MDKIKIPTLTSQNARR